MENKKVVKVMPLLKQEKSEHVVFLDYLHELEKQIALSHISAYAGLEVLAPNSRSMTKITITE